MNIICWQLFGQPVLDILGKRLMSIASHIFCYHNLFVVLSFVNSLIHVPANFPPTLWFMLQSGEVGMHRYRKLLRKPHVSKICYHALLINPELLKKTACVQLIWILRCKFCMRAVKLAKLTSQDLDYLNTSGFFQ